ncbi:calcium-dependent protein kinase SK5-like protein, partial [Tanacetum coccineum]
MAVDDTKITNKLMESEIKDLMDAHLGSYAERLYEFESSTQMLVNIAFLRTAPKKSRRVGSLETVSSMNSKGDYGNTFKGRNWRLKELFKMINIDNSGTITFEELKEGMRRVGSELMESEIKD